MIMDIRTQQKIMKTFRRQNIRHVNLKISLKKKAAYKRKILTVTE